MGRGSPVSIVRNMPSCLVSADSRHFRLACQIVRWSGDLFGFPDEYEPGPEHRMLGEHDRPCLCLDPDAASAEIGEQLKLRAPEAARLRGAGEPCSVEG